jgi:hypothetical protein
VIVIVSVMLIDSPGPASGAVAGDVVVVVLVVAAMASIGFSATDVVVIDGERGIVVAPLVSSSVAQPTRRSMATIETARILT